MRRDLIILYSNEDDCLTTNDDFNVRYVINSITINRSEAVYYMICRLANVFYEVCYITLIVLCIRTGLN